MAIPMLSTEDLQAIGQLIDERATKPLQKDIAEKIGDLEGRMNTKINAVQEQLDGLENRMDMKFDAVQEQLDDLENRMDMKFDAVQEQLDGIENSMITLNGLERWEEGLTKRYDTRYIRQ